MAHLEKLRIDSNRIVKLYEGADGRVTMLTRGRPPVLLSDTCGCEQRPVAGTRGSTITKLCDDHAIEAGLKGAK